MKVTLIATKSILVVLLMLARPGSSRAAWPTAHGSPANTGFARVDTLPASAPIGFADVGPVAAGANPVTGPDGTVYIGNLAGELIALFPDGKPYWKRTIYSNQGAIVASPVVGADGSVYVVSSYSYADHRGGGSTQVHASFLHKFLPGGGWSWTPFPKSGTDGGVTAAPPNIWAWNGSEAVMIPVVYKGLYGTELHLIAFSTSGTVLADKLVTFRSYQINSSTSSIWEGIFDFIDDCIVKGPGCAFSANQNRPPWPQPGVAIWQDPQSSPWVWVADDLRSTVAYKFDPAKGFSEILRFSDPNDRQSSPPVALDNVVAAVGTEDGRLKFERENFFIAGFGSITAAPTRLNDGRLVVIDQFGGMSLINSHSVVLQTRLNGSSIASAAASCTHLFVSTTDELVTFDLKIMAPVASMGWPTHGGGFSAPIIGPLGHVYALSSSGLLVFAAPRKPSLQSTFATACDPPSIVVR
jgi:hypothetical protein